MKGRILTLVALLVAGFASQAQAGGLGLALAARAFGFRNDRVIVVNNGVDLRDFDGCSSRGRGISNRELRELQRQRAISRALRNRGCR